MAFSETLHNKEKVSFFLILLRQEDLIVLLSLYFKLKNFFFFRGRLSFKYKVILLNVQFTFFKIASLLPL